MKFLIKSCSITAQDCRISANEHYILMVLTVASSTPVYFLETETIALPSYIANRISLVNYQCTSVITFKLIRRMLHE